MNKFLLAAAFFAAAASPAAAAAITVANVGPILNESIPLPAESTPGSSIAFAEFFEFSLPVQEEVTVSMTDSAIGNEKIVGGVLSINNWTSTGPAPLFIPAGSLIESSPVANFIGGQGATVVPDLLAAGNYFAEISGTSGSRPMAIAIDGTATATTVVGATIPEPSTWAMLLIGGAFMAWGAARRRRVSSTMVDSLT
jgi:hypothetical protein